MASLLSLHLPKLTSPIKSSSSSSSSSGAATTTTTQPPLQSLEDKFGRKGIKFTESSVELTVRNGSSLRLRIPDGLITSYKPKVYWKDDGFEEVLYTVPGVNGGSVRGGLGLVLNDASKSWAASEWAVKDADSDSFDAVQVT